MSWILLLLVNVDAPYSWRRGWSTDELWRRAPHRGTTNASLALPAGVKHCSLVGPATTGRGLPLWTGGVGGLSTQHLADSSMAQLMMPTLPAKTGMPLAALPVPPRDRDDQSDDTLKFQPGLPELERIQKASEQKTEVVVHKGQHWQALRPIMPVCIMLLYDSAHDLIRVLHIEQGSGRETIALEVKWAELGTRTRPQTGNTLPNAKGPMVELYKYRYGSPSAAIAAIFVSSLLDCLTIS